MADTPEAKRSDVALPSLIGLVLAIGVFIGSVVAKNHFGPLDGLCNGATEVEPHQSAGAVVNCGLDTTIYSLASLAYWGAIVVGALSALALALGLAVAPEKLVAANSQPKGAKTPRSSGRGTAGPNAAPARDADRQHIRCARCNALNYAHSGDVPCYACGIPLGG
jgi:ribosomal protein L37E